MPLTIRQIRIKPSPGKLWPHHPAPVRPHRSIRREQAWQEHRLRCKRAKLGPFVVIELRSQDGLDIRGLDGVDALLGMSKGGDDGVRVPIAAVDAAEVALEEVAADRSFVDFVFAVKAPGHGEGIRGVRYSEAGVGAAKGLEALFLKDDANEAVKVVNGY